MGHSSHTENCRKLLTALEFLAHEFQRDFVTAHIIELISPDCPPCRQCSCYIERQAHSGKVYMFELSVLHNLVKAALEPPPATVIDIFASDVPSSH
jgi:hypothetical protein